LFVPTFALQKKATETELWEQATSHSLSSSNVPVGFRSNQVGPLLSKCQREKKQEWRRRIEFYVARASEGGEKKMALLHDGVASRLTTLPAFLHGCHCFCTNKQWPNYEWRRGQPGKQTCHATRVTPLFLWAFLLMAHFVSCIFRLDRLNDKDSLIYFDIFFTPTTPSDDPRTLYGVELLLARTSSSQWALFSLLVQSKEGCVASIHI
jgi:hypothetical protein